MMCNPKVSVILPIYNVEAYLKQSLDSLMNQTLKEVEFICVDDCSTDGSFEILQEYAKKDARFVILKQKKNQGPGIARNKGLEAAKGDYIMFLDPDDWYELDACETAYNQISANNNDFVIFAYNKFYEETGEYEYKKRMIKPFLKRKDDAEINPNKIKKNMIISAYVWALIYKKEFLKNNNINYHESSRNFEDHLFFAYLFTFANSISIIEKPLCNYRVRSTSLTNVWNNQSKDLYKVKRKILEVTKQLNPSKNKKISIYAHIINSCIFWLHKYTELFPEHEAELYKNVRKILLKINRDFVENAVKNVLKQDRYEEYLYIINNSWFSIKLNRMKSAFEEWKNKYIKKI